MAAAYYAAEAAQTTAGAQQQIATESFAAQTAQTGLQAGAAVAINQANATAATSIASSQYGAATTLGTVQSNDALAAVQSNNAYSLATTQSNNQASTTIAALNTVIPQEIALTGGWANLKLPGMDALSVGTAATPSLDALMGLGYSRAQAQQLAGV
jgi:hypothetical protein